MKAIITVGMGFGDEGKGATVDYLTRQYKAGWVVRYSGGAQAGHNVVLPNGQRHAFSQFGAGTLAGAKTYLGPRVIACPGTLPQEARHLETLGISDSYQHMVIHPDCLLSTAYHVAMNRMRECARGDSRHGSCGLGIGETRSYWLRHGSDAVVAADLHDRSVLVSKLRLLRDRMLLSAQDLSSIDAQYMDRVYHLKPGEEADQIMEAMSPLKQQHELPACELTIFEGAQGVLLDERCGFHPHTTWSTVTALHAIELLAAAGINDFITLGISRAYLTRHGAGPFPTYDKTMTQRRVDHGNPNNAWQGGIKSGPLDLVLLNYAFEHCPVDGWVVNHMDQMNRSEKICLGYRDCRRLLAPTTLKEQGSNTQRLHNARPIYSTLEQDELLDMFETLAPVYLTGHGPTHRERHLTRSGKLMLLNESSFPKSKTM